MQASIVSSNQLHKINTHNCFTSIMKKLSVIFGFIFITFYLSCTKDTTPTNASIDEALLNLISSTAGGGIDHYKLPDYKDLSAIPEDSKNPLTEEKVRLGQMLFFETGLAVDAMKPESVGTYSCATCHNPMAGFKPNNFQGIADGGVGLGTDGDGRLMNTSYLESEIDVQSARPLSLVNVAYVTNTMWNGMFGAHHVNEGTEDRWLTELGNHTNHEGFDGIMSSNLEGQLVHRLNISKEFCDSNGYTEYFDAAFPDVDVSERYSQVTVVRALSNFIRTIIATDAPFQRFIKGDGEAMTMQEKRGADLFFSKARCVSCHNSPGLSAVDFHVLGVKDMFQIPSYNADASDFRNLGRGGFTGKVQDLYKFKIPTVYNLDDTKFFFHGSSMNTLEEVVEYKDRAVSENPNIPDSLLSPLFTPIGLTAEQKADLVAFLRNGLRDPNLARYFPDELPSGNCFPNADQQSKIDLGCY